ncbi:MAG: phosphoribosylformylglycinamidine synthase subunit PurL [Chloroflexi bacterium]|nr:phosphoribosylformylglycinamidine synthase subunit PurL [Chloroflexota bacterium]
MTSLTNLDQLLDELALPFAEYDQICEELGRPPNPVELGMFGALWSEHCGYKNSKPLLKLLPTTGPRVVQGPGENAGAVDIGDGLCVVFKIESHNHPSAIEPYQGAATGVGGIVRDIFTMGARPIAILDSLRFGPLTEARNRYLFGGVVGGIGGYGNPLGIPTVGGEVVFAGAYSHNPLVNAMCVGVVESDRLIRARASGVGNVLLLVGADTGRDGIHGCSGLASRELSDRTEEQRPTVQVGNPFLEKLLMEACLELLGDPDVVALQDLGAAGLTSAVVECASRGGVGAEIDVQKVSRREQGMNAFEVMLSESQERMLVVVRRGAEERVQQVFARWGLHSDVIGQVTGDGLVRVRDGGEVVAEIPATLLTEPPTYRRQGVKPAWLADLQAADLDALPDVGQAGAPFPSGWGALLALLASPTIASKEIVYRRYDHQVQTNTVVGPGSDAAVLRIKGTRQGIALKTDGNGRLCYLDPFAGGALAVAEATRNVVCAGGEPIAITNCLNFGNPEKSDIYYQLEEAIKGMAAACRALGVPVVSGNVSLYNETRGEAIYPTPIVGAVGLLPDRATAMDLAFKEPGDAVLLLGPWTAEAAALAGSEYLEVGHGLVAGRPAMDLDLEVRVQRACLEAIRAGLVRSAHDCSEGGLAVAVAESCIAGNLGAQLDVPAGGRLDAGLFGESPSRIVLSARPEHVERLQAIAARHAVPLRRLGTVGADRLTIGEAIAASVANLRSCWAGALERAVNSQESAVSHQPSAGS